jgi:CRISPR/Cas system CSM-associated protein Csm3 (group 7 of RAMP superfamily)
VGIDRRSGTSAGGILFGRAVLPRGVFVRLELDVETTVARLETDRAFVAALLLALAAGQVRLGGGKTRGLGHVLLAASPAAEVREQRFDSFEGVLASFGDGRPLQNALQNPRNADADLAAAGLPDRREIVEVEVAFRALAPVMVRADGDGLAVDALPLTSGRGRGLRAPVLPGSSLKGALRSRAELIARTLMDEDAAAAGPDAGSVAQARAFRASLDQVEVVKALFGAAAPPRRRDEPDDPWGVGAVAVDDCYAAETTFTAAEWAQARDGVPVDGDPADGDHAQHPAAVRTALAGKGLAKADHVAIDRWTGGAAEGRLYSVLEPYGVEWEPIRLRVDAGRLRQLRDPALALLLLVLRDLAAGRVPIGYATNRGMGDIAVAGMAVRGLGGRDWDDLDALLASPLARSLSAAWADHVARPGRPAGAGAQAGAR